MKKYAYNLLFFLGGVALLGLAACSSDDDGNGMPEVEANIVATAQATADLSSLVAALSTADELDNTDLIGILSGPGPFTVFAPSNAAFSQLFNSLDGYDSLDDFDTDAEKELLASILTYHVVAGVAAQSGDLSDGANVTTVQGESLTTSISGGVSVVDATGTPANVTTADVVASNGVVHIIDKVLLPQAVLDALEEAAAEQNIVELANATADLSALVNALIEADLVSTLEGDGPFTVFAPTNDAFATFLSVNGYTSLDDIPNEVLVQVLLNHVVAGELAAADLSTGYISSSSTAGPDDANLSLFINTEGGVRVNGVSSVSTPDVEASNGIVHIVDAVIDIPTVVTFATADPTFAPLVTALTDGTPATDFPTVLSGDGPFTVFAPTDAAFQALLDSNPDWDTVTDIDEALLTSVLNHHVVSGNVRSGDLTDGIMPATLEGDAITINLPGTGDNIADVTDGSGTSGIGIIAVDVQAGNGVVHVLNQVMIPDTTN